MMRAPTFRRCKATLQGCKATERSAVAACCSGLLQGRMLLLGRCAGCRDTGARRGCVPARSCVEKAVVVSSRVIIHTFIHYTNFAHSVTYTETSCPMQASKTAIISKIQNASASVCSAIGKLSIGKVDDVAVRANAESSAIKSALVGGLPALKKTVTRVTRADGSVRCSSRNAAASAHV